MEYSQLIILSREQLEELHRNHVKYGTTAKQNTNVLILEIAIALNLPELWTHRELWALIKEVRKPSLERFVENYPSINIKPSASKTALLREIALFTQDTRYLIFPELLEVLRSGEEFGLNISPEEIMECYKNLGRFETPYILQPAGLSSYDQIMFNHCQEKGLRFTKRDALICAASFVPRRDRTPRENPIFQSESEVPSRIFVDAVNGGYNENWPGIFKTVFQYPPHFDYPRYCELDIQTRHPDSLRMLVPRLYSNFLSQVERMEYMIKGFEVRKEEFLQRLQAFNDCRSFGHFAAEWEVLISILTSPYFDECTAWIKNEISHQDLVNRLNLVVPSGTVTTRYIADWLLTRVRRIDNSFVPDIHIPSSLDLASDAQIINLFDGQLKYKTRKQLVEKARNKLLETKFFTLRRLRRNVNDKTTLLEDCVIDGMIGFGNEASYRVYSFLELDGAFASRPPGRTVCRIPDDPNRYFTSDEMDSLKSHVKARDNESLHLKLKNTVLVTADSTDGCIETLYSNPEVGKELLRKITDLGLYMRRWKGIVGLWPYNDADTIGQNNPEIEVLPRLVEFVNYLETNEVMKNVYSGLLVYAPGVQNISECNLKKFMEDIAKGSECIRMASARLIWTADLYSKKSYGCPVYEGMDAGKFVRIA